MPYAFDYEVTLKDGSRIELPQDEMAGKANLGWFEDFAKFAKKAPMPNSNPLATLVIEDCAQVLLNLRQVSGMLVCSANPKKQGSTVYTVRLRGVGGNPGRILEATLADDRQEFANAYKKYLELPDSPETTPYTGVFFRDDCGLIVDFREVISIKVETLAKV